MKKITKIVASVLCLTCMSVALTGCEAKEKADNWFEKVFGWLTPDDKDETPDDSTDDKDEENKDSTNTGTNSGNENTGNEDNKNEENSGGNSSGEVENTKFEGSGEMYVDHVNKISIRPTKTTVGVGETFLINVEKDSGCTITENATFTVLSTGTQGVLSVDENGNVTALKVGEGAVQVTLGTVNYLVNITVIEETTDNTTYILSCTHKYADRTIVIKPYEVKMRVGDTFTLDVSTTSTDEPVIEMAEVNGGKWTTIDNLTVTAVKTGETQIWIEWGEDYPFLIYVTII